MSVFCGESCNQMNVTKYFYNLYYCQDIRIKWVLDGAIIRATTAAESAKQCVYVCVVWLAKTILKPIQWEGYEIKLSKTISSFKPFCSVTVCVQCTFSVSNFPL